MRLHPRTILLAHLIATLPMVGVIWFVQIVHYPLLASVDPSAFPGYVATNIRSTSLVVAPLMLVEAATGLSLLWRRPQGVANGSVWVGAVLMALIWGMTILVHIPQHRALAEGFDPAIHRALLSTNWVRTVAWTARGLLVQGMLLGALGHESRDG